MTALQMLVAVGLPTGLVIMTIALYRANQKTPVPEGCENLKPDCAGCGITDCSIRNKEKGETK